MLWETTISNVFFLKNQELRSENPFPKVPQSSCIFWEAREILALICGTIRRYLGLVGTICYYVAASLLSFVLSYVTKRSPPERREASFASRLVTKSIFSCHTDTSRLSGGDLFITACLLYTSPSPRDTERSRMPSSA